MLRRHGIHSFIFISTSHKTNIVKSCKIQIRWYGGCDQKAKRPEVITPQHKNTQNYKVNLQSNKYIKWTDITEKMHIHTQQNKKKKKKHK